MRTPYLNSNPKGPRHFPPERLQLQRNTTEGSAKATKSKYNHIPQVEMGSLEPRQSSRSSCHTPWRKFCVTMSCPFRLNKTSLELVKPLGFNILSTKVLALQPLASGRRHKGDWCKNGGANSEEKEHVIHLLGLDGIDPLGQLPWELRTKHLVEQVQYHKTL